MPDLKLVAGFAVIDTQDDGTPLNFGDGDGTSGGMDAWQTSVESRLAELSSRVLWLAGGIGGGFLVLLTIMLARTDTLGDRVAAVDRTATVVVQKVDQSEQRLERIEHLLDERLPAQKK